jgi:hypothetical protein
MDRFDCIIVWRLQICGIHVLPIYAAKYYLHSELTFSKQTSVCVIFSPFEMYNSNGNWFTVIFEFHMCNILEHA